MDSAKLTTNAKLTAAVLWKHAKTDGTNVYPAQSRTAQMSGLSVKAVQRAVNELEHFGWLQRDGTMPSGRGRPVIRWKLTRPIE